MIRRLPFAGALNFRDIGGYQSGHGGQTRWAAVYRSDSLHFLAEDDLPAFDALGVKTIYDLRRASERERFPGPREHIHLEIPTGPFDSARTAALKTRRDGEQSLLTDYLWMLANAGPSFGELFSRLAESERLPAVIHCYSGKDRTGLAAALLLTALGVGRETVLDDYELTNDYRGVERVPDTVDRFVDAGIARDAAEGMLSAPRWAMARALDDLDGGYAGIDSYLLGSGRMNPGTLRALRAALVG